jgi:hypothetical protein|tara:strand:- start:1593 stop:1781 length:189 start_codon:yes stop_codon:yes gene_type:complete
MEYPSGIKGVIILVIKIRNVLKPIKEKKTSKESSVDWNKTIENLNKGYWDLNYLNINAAIFH